MFPENCICILILFILIRELFPSSFSSLIIDDFRFVVKKKMF